MTPHEATAPNWTDVLRSLKRDSSVLDIVTKILKHDPYVWKVLQRHANQEHGTLAANDAELLRGWLEKVKEMGSVV